MMWRRKIWGSEGLKGFGVVGEVGLLAGSLVDMGELVNELVSQPVQNWKTPKSGGHFGTKAARR